MRRQKRIVIDASIGATASPNSADAASLECFQFLYLFRKLRFRAAMSRLLFSEWQRHASGWSASWLADMASRRLVAEFHLGPEGVALQIDELDISAKQRKAMRKDAHLLDTALAADKTAASLDEEARSLYRRHCRQLGLSALIWVNPALLEQAQQWLKAGARAESRRKLCPDA